MFTVDKVMNPVDLTKELLAQNQGPQYNPKSYQEHVEHMKSKAHNNETEAMFEAAERRRMARLKHQQFSDTLSENFLEACLCTVFDKVMEAEAATTHEMAIGHSMLSKLIKEEGVVNLLSRFETKNLILSEFARYTDKYHKMVMEATKDKIEKAPEDDTCYVLDKDIAERFIDDVKDLVPDRVIDIIRDRVTDAMQTFIDQNTENKIAIKDIYMKSKLAVDNAADDEIKQEGAIRAKILTNRVYDKPVSVYTAMVNTIGESVLKNDDLKKEYTDGTKIKMEHLCNDVRVMYTVLEMANTLNIVDVNENYIKQVITDLKEL